MSSTVMNGPVNSGSRSTTAINNNTNDVNKTNASEHSFAMNNNSSLSFKQIIDRGQTSFNEMKQNWQSYVEKTQHQQMKLFEDNVHTIAKDLNKMGIKVHMPDVMKQRTERELEVLRKEELLHMRKFCETTARMVRLECKLKESERERMRAMVDDVLTDEIVAKVTELKMKVLEARERRRVADEEFERAYLRLKEREEFIEKNTFSAFPNALLPASLKATGGQSSTLVSSPRDGITNKTNNASNNMFTISSTTSSTDAANATTTTATMNNNNNKNVAAREEQEQEEVEEEEEGEEETLYMNNKENKNLKIETKKKKKKPASPKKEGPTQKRVSEKEEVFELSDETIYNNKNKNNFYSRKRKGDDEDVKEREEDEEDDEKKKDNEYEEKQKLSSVLTRSILTALLQKRHLTEEENPQDIIKLEREVHQIRCVVALQRIYRREKLLRTIRLENKSKRDAKIRAALISIVVIAIVYISYQLVCLVVAVSGNIYGRLFVMEPHDRDVIFAGSKIGSFKRRPPWYITAGIVDLAPLTHARYSVAMNELDSIAALASESSAESSMESSFIINNKKDEQEYASLELERIRLKYEKNLEMQRVSFQIELERAQQNAQSLFLPKAKRKRGENEKRAANKNEEHPTIQNNVAIENSQRILERSLAAARRRELEAKALLAEKQKQFSREIDKYKQTLSEKLLRIFWTMFIFVLSIAIVVLVQDETQMKSVLGIYKRVVQNVKFAHKEMVQRERSAVHGSAYCK